MLVRVLAVLLLLLSVFDLMVIWLVFERFLEGSKDPLYDCVVHWSIEGHPFDSPMIMRQIGPRVWAYRIFVWLFPVLVFASSRLLRRLPRIR